MDKKRLDGSARKEKVLAIERVGEILWLFWVEIEFEFFFNWWEEILLVDFDSFADELFGFDELNLKFEVGKSGLFVAGDLVGLDENRITTLVQAQVLPNIETHSYFPLFDVFMKTALEYLVVDEHVDDSGGVLGHFGREINWVLDGVLVTQMLDAGRGKLHLLLDFRYKFRKKLMYKLAIISCII